MKKLQDLSKEELIKLVQNLQEEKNLDNEAIQKTIEECEENNLNHESFMESHGMVDYGYGVGRYGAL